MAKQITNVIFFLRHDEPRIPTLDLYECLEKQLETANKYDFPTTYLLEYDALIDERYTRLLKAKANKKSEVGGWFEIVKQLCDKAGLPWRGREGYTWDWHCHCGFSVGYTKQERRLLIDTYMKEFFSIFGCYPKSMGSWLIDAYSLEYMEKKYGVIASCNCRDQWGTDGYTLWGGYYGQGFYPSKNNALCPAQTKENQINIPVFRMLGIDYLHQYDLNLDINGGTYNNRGAQSALTLEPIYDRNGSGGGNPDWTDWYLKENFPADTLSFNYVHVGQENSFLWSDQEKGTYYQFDKLKALENEGKMEMQTLSQTAEWYRNTYPLTPASTVKADTDWRKGYDCKTIWYNCKNYRLNVYSSHGKTWIRDLCLFREDYTERYMDEVCTTTYMTYDNLHVVDGTLYSGNGTRAGLYLSLVKNGREKDLVAVRREISYPDDSTAKIKLITASDDVVYITLNEEGMTVLCETADVRMVIKADKTKPLPYVRAEGNTLYMSHRGYDYSITAEGAEITYGDSISFSDAKEIKLILNK